jgi:hypothetical protein
MTSRVPDYLEEGNCKIRKRDAGAAVAQRKRDDERKYPGFASHKIKIRNDSA